MSSIGSGTPEFRWDPSMSESSKCMFLNTLDTNSLMEAGFYVKYVKDGAQERLEIRKLGEGSSQRGGMFARLFSRAKLEQLNSDQEIKGLSGRDLSELKHTHFQGEHLFQVAKKNLGGAIQQSSVKSSKASEQKEGDDYLAQEYKNSVAAELWKEIDRLNSPEALALSQFLVESYETDQRAEVTKHSNVRPGGRLHPLSRAALSSDIPLSYKISFLNKHQSAVNELLAEMGSDLRWENP